MKPLTACLVASSLLVLPRPDATAASPQAVSGLPAYTVSVGAFQNTSGFHWKWDVASTWQTILTAALDEEQRVVVLTNGAASAADAQGAPAAPGPAQLLVQGAVTHVDAERSQGSSGVALKGVNLRLGGRDHARVNVTVSVVDAVTGRVLAATDVEGDAKRRSVNIGYTRYVKSGDISAIRKEGLGRAMEDAAVATAEWLAAGLGRIPWKGAVVAVQGDEVFVNRGQREGVRPGMTFVTGEEESLRDPTTGEVLKSTFRETARLEVTTLEERLSTCRLVSGDLAALQPGSEVRLP